MVKFIKNKWFLKTIKMLLIGFIVFCWFIYLRENWNSLAHYNWTVNWALTILSFGLFLAGYLLFGSLWSPLRFQITGLRMSLQNAFRISAMAWMGRYVPGKIWAFAGKVYLSTSDKNQIAGVGTAVAVETLLFEVSGLLLAMIILPFCSTIKLMPSSAMVASCVLIVFSLILIHPKILCPAVNSLLRLLRQNEISHCPRYGMMLIIILGYMSTFLAWGTAFTIFAHSVTPLSLTDFPIFVAVFSISWVFGYLMLLAPAGLGVRELVMAIVLQPLLPTQADIIIVVAGARLLTTLAEMFCLLIALVIRHLNFQIAQDAWPEKNVK
jgi:hypothetical protein